MSKASANEGMGSAPTFSRRTFLYSDGAYSVREKLRADGKTIKLALRISSDPSDCWGYVGLVQGDRMIALAAWPDEIVQAFWMPDVTPGVDAADVKQMNSKVFASRKEFIA